MADTLPIRDRLPLEPPEPPEPPAHLDDDAADIWRSIVSEWVLGADALPLLQAACECWGRYQQAAAVLEEEGPTVVNPDSGNTRQHPAHTVCRDNLREFRQLFRQLKLEPPEIEQ